MYAGSGMGQLAKVRSTCRMLNVITCSIRQTLLDCSELCTKFSRPVLLNGTFNPRFYLESSAGFEGRELCGERHHTSSCLHLPVSSLQRSSAFPARTSGWPRMLWLIVHRFRVFSSQIAFVLKVHGTLTSRDGWKRTDSIHGQKGSCCSASFKYSEAFRFVLVVGYCILFPSPLLTLHTNEHQEVCPLLTLAYE